jgi:hypothetical protein
MVCRESKNPGTGSAVRILLRYDDLSECYVYCSLAALHLTD